MRTHPHYRIYRPRFGWLGRLRFLFTRRVGWSFLDRLYEVSIDFINYRVTARFVNELLAIDDYYRRGYVVKSFYNVESIGSLILPDGISVGFVVALRSGEERHYYYVDLPDKLSVLRAGVIQTQHRPHMFLAA